MDINNLVKHQYHIAIDRTKTIKDQNIEAKRIILNHTNQYWWDRWYASKESLKNDFDQHSVNILTELTNIIT